MTSFPEIPLLLETKDLLVVEKPELLASIQERDREQVSLHHILQETRGERLFIVHRLDKEVSGVILFARNAEAHRHLNDQFAGRDVQKTYIAVVHGVIPTAGGSIERALRQFGSGRVGVDDRGKRAETHFDVEERWPASTLVKALPRTGRRHQIRVHFYSIEHPIVGDTRYGDQALQRDFFRLMLHARTLSFTDRGGMRVTVESPLPPSFLLACERLKRT